MSESSIARTLVHACKDTRYTQRMNATAQMTLIASIYNVMAFCRRKYDTFKHFNALFIRPYTAFLRHFQRYRQNWIHYFFVDFCVFLMCPLFLVYVDVYVHWTVTLESEISKIVPFSLISQFDRVIEFEISFKPLKAFYFFFTIVQMRRREKKERERERWKKKIGSWLQQFCVINKQMKI